MNSTYPLSDSTGTVCTTPRLGTPPTLRGPLHPVSAKLLATASTARVEHILILLVSPLRIVYLSLNPLFPRRLPSPCTRLSEAEVGVYLCSTFGERNNHAHPTRKQTPPMGVIAPSQRVFVAASTYSVPEKTRMPARKARYTPRR